jgi:diadenylate cyclase
MLFRIGFLSVSWIDVLDIIIVAFLFYRLYLVMRGTIAAQIFVGLILIIAFSFVAQAASLTALTWILKTLTDIWVIAFIVLFQPELRRLLIIVGRNRIVRMFLRLNVAESIDEVVEACRELSQKQWGALIIIIRATGMRTFVETGVPLQAKVTKQLLISIFTPKGPLHDGAIIIKDRLIEAARCTLPLSAVTHVDHITLGMRHRAGLGISEQADVLAVIVSEETGRISLAENGLLMHGLSPEELRVKLREGMMVKPEVSAKAIFNDVKQPVE